MLFKIQRADIDGLNFTMQGPCVILLKERTQKDNTPSNILRYFSLRFQPLIWHYKIIRCVFKSQCKVCSKRENMCFETVPHGTLGKSSKQLDTR